MFQAILLLAFVAISMAVETSEGKAKESQDADAARDKRGLSSYYSPYAYAPYAYKAYNLPYSYSAYPYSAYPYYNQHYYNYPYYNQLSHYY